MPKSLFVIASRLLLLAAFAAIPGAANAAVICQRESCLLARDINGLRLDMTIQKVSALLPTGLTPLGRGQFKAERDGTSYDIEFSALGHLFRIDSSQKLGSFQPDRAFGLSLMQKLTEKYGPPHANQLPDGPAFWQFVRPYIENDGQQLMRETESLSAMLGSTYNGPVTLDMKLMDFRILRRDQAILNREPEAQAQGLVHF